MPQVLGTDVLAPAQVCALTRRASTLISLVISLVISPSLSLPLSHSLPFTRSLSRTFLISYSLSLALSLSLTLAHSHSLLLSYSPTPPLSISLFLRAAFIHGFGLVESCSHARGRVCKRGRRLRMHLCMRTHAHATARTLQPISVLRFWISEGLTQT